MPEFVPGGGFIDPQRGFDVRESAAEQTPEQIAEEATARQEALEASFDEGEPEPEQSAEEPPEAPEELGEPAEQVPDGTVSEVRDWVGDDTGRAQQALDAERDGQQRSTLINQLEDMLSNASSSPSQECSHVIEEVEDPTVELEPTPRSNSLAERMRARADQLARNTTSRFPLPGYEDVIEVELRASGIKENTHVQERLQRVRDPGDRNLYLMCDLLLRATVGFYEVAPNGEATPMENETWQTLAALNPDCPPTVTPRQALLFLLGESRLQYLYVDWETWQRSARPEDDEELRSDFGSTG